MDYGGVQVVADLERTDLDVLKPVVARFVTGLAGPAGSVVGPFLLPILSGQISALIGWLNSLLSAAGDIDGLLVSFHEPPTPSATPTPSPTGSPSGYALTVTMLPPSEPIPSLELRSCGTLRGPWTGNVLGGPDHPELPVSFSLNARLAATPSASDHEVQNQDGDVFTSDFTYDFVVQATGGDHPGLTFTRATSEVTTVIDAKGGSHQVLHGGPTTMPSMKVGTVWPLGAGSC